MEQCKREDHQGPPALAVFLVRWSCPHCGAFSIYAVCEHCYNRVQTSGRPMRCTSCGVICTAEDKLKRWVRIGDA